jgi:hypothetical protein
MVKNNYCLGGTITRRPCELHPFCIISEKMIPPCCNYFSDLINGKEPYAPPSDHQKEYLKNIFSFAFEGIKEVLYEEYTNGQIATINDLKNFISRREVIEEVKKKAFSSLIEFYRNRNIPPFLPYNLEALVELLSDVFFFCKTPPNLLMPYQKTDKQNYTNIKKMLKEIGIDSALRPKDIKNLFKL